MDFVRYLSYPLSENTPLYGNGTCIELAQVQQQRLGDSCNTMKWTIPNHAGTHIDAPRHFSETGRTITDYSPEFWIFHRVELVDISHTVEDGQLIEPALLPRFIHENPELLLIKTGYGKYRGTSRYTLTPPGISENLAFWLKERYPSIRCIGVDLISISSYARREDGRKAHHAFLSQEKGSPILLIEDMDLSLDEKLKQVIVSPVLVDQADGSPCMVLGIFE